MSFWDDPVFAGTAQPISATTADTTLKQSVGKIELTDDQLQLYKEEPPKFTSWDGFWADPVFANVAGREAPLPEGETREFWKYELDESVSLSSLFPDLSSTAFGSVAFRKSAIEWWSKPILDKPAGLYLRTEIEFNGLLDGIFEVFKQFLGDEAKPTLRISAYLGVTQVPDGTYASDGLTFEGSLLGLKSQMPPGLELVTILSVGVQVNVGKTNTTTEIESFVAPAKSEDVSCAIIGELHASFPGLTGPLLLAYKASLGETFLRLDMTIPGDGKWRSPLGVESLLLDEAKFSINIPLPKTVAKPSDDTVLAASKQDVQALAPTTESQEQTALLPGGATAAQLDASLSFTVSAKWKTSSNGVVKLTGAIYKQYPDASYIEGTLERVTWSDIKKLFSDIHGEDLATSDHEITCEKLTIRISKAQLLLRGSLSIDGRHLAAATIAITSAGILIRADVHEFSIDDGYVTIHDASLTLMIGKAATTASPEGKEKQPETTQKGWYGGLEVAGRITIKEGVSKPMDIRVVFTGGKQNGKMFWVLCGSMDSDVSLRDIVSSIDEHSELDLRLKSVCLVASNIDSPKCHLNTNGYVIRPGFYLWATLQKIPCIQIGGKVKEPAAGDTTQLSIGWKKGSKIPNVSIFLPKSLKIDIGPRFRTNRFELQIGSDRSLRFVGGFQVRMDDNTEWLQFDLATEVKALEVAGELVFTGHINNPFGLSKEITIGPKLALGVKFKWPVLVATGLPTGGGILGSFYLGKVSPDNAYGMALYVCEDPKDMLIKVNAPSMDYYKLIQFVGAIMDREVPATDMEILQLKDVDIYASGGVAFAGDYYPAGIRFKGKIIVFDHEAGMDCSLTTEGLRLKAWLQTIELGPLSIGGTMTLPDKPGVTFALLDLELSMTTQKFILNGFVKIFNLSASIDLHIQLMPDPAFFFNFELLWSDLLSIKAKAFMISKGEEKSLSRKLANADWTIDVAIEQQIIQRMVETIRTALEKFHAAVKAKIAVAHGAVAAAEAEYKAGIEEAQKTLISKRSEYNRRHNELDDKIAALEREANSGMSARNKDIQDAKTNETKSTQEARLERDRKVYEKENEVNAKRNEYEHQEQKGRHDENAALSARELRKQDFYAKFGEADASLQRALNELSNANRSVDSIRGEIDHVEWQLKNGPWYRAPDLGIQAGALYAALGTAKAGLAIAEASVQLVKDTMNSGPFQSMKQVWLDASEVFETVKTMAAKAVQEALNQLKIAEGLLSAAKSAIEGDFEKAKREAREVVDKAQESYNTYKEAQRIEGEKLQIQLEQLKNSTQAAAVTTAEAALEVAKNNNIAFKAAQAGLDALDTINDAVYTTLDAAVQAAGTICDIRVARLTGTLTANKQEQKPFKIYLEGTLLKDELKLNLDFTPGETGKFLKDVSSEALALITPGKKKTV